MNTKTFILWLNSVVLLVSGCATTDLSDFTDPAYRGTTFVSVVVWAYTDDIEWQQELESILVNTIVTTTAASAARVIDIAPPTRGFTTEETIQLVAGTGAEAALVFEFTETGIRTDYHVDSLGNIQKYNKPWGNANVYLLDVNGPTIAWTGDSKTRGNAFADWNEIRKSAGQKIIQRLLEVGLLPPIPTEDQGEEDKQTKDKEHST